MGRVHTKLREDAHGYTRSKVPWDLDEYRGARGETSQGVKFGWKLFHYIAGGGMNVFGRSVRQIEAETKRNRFLIAFGILLALWLWFMFVD